MAWINDWIEWREQAAYNEPQIVRKAVFLLIDKRYWMEIKPSPELRAVIDLMEPFNKDAWDRVDQYELEDELVKSLGYEVLD